jgi:hypothetical protein
LHAQAADPVVFRTPPSYCKVFSYYARPCII